MVQMTAITMEMETHSEMAIVFSQTIAAFAQRPSLSQSAVVNKNVQKKIVEEKLQESR